MFFVGSRTIIFQPYGEERFYTAQNKLMMAGQDIQWTFSLKNITRPKIILLWNTKIMNSVVKYTYIYGFNGNYNRYKITFQAIEFDIKDVNELSSSFPIWTNFLNQGGTFEFTGCVFKNLATGDRHSIIGAGEIASMQVTFSGIVYFDPDTIDPKGQFFYFASGSWNITLSDDREAGIVPDIPNDNKDLELLPSNGVAYLSRNSAFSNAVQIIYNPTKSYKNITTNFMIDMDK